MSAVFGYGARAVGVCLERPRRATRRPRPAGTTWRRSSASRATRAATSPSSTATPSADEIKAQTIALLKQRGAKLDSVVYSLASPKRTDPKTGVTLRSVLKPLGAPFVSKSIGLGNDQVQTVEIAPATDADVEATRKVMGGEDFGAVDARAARRRSAAPRAAAPSPTATSARS